MFSAQDTKKVILIPTYNEKDNIAALIAKISEQKLNFDILIIDDNSPDGTGQLAEEIAKKNSQVKVLHRKGKEGLGKAYQEGFRWALDNHYEIIMQMDADLSHDPAVLPLFMKEIENHDAVFGSRYYNGVRVHNWSFKRLLLSKVSNEFISRTLNINATDTTTAYKCFRRNVIESLHIERFKGKQNAFLIELVYATIKSGFKTKEVPFTFVERVTGESKMKLSVAYESFVTVFRLFFFGR